MALSNDRVIGFFQIPKTTRPQERGTVRALALGWILWLFSCPVGWDGEWLEGYWGISEVVDRKRRGIGHFCTWVCFRIRWIHGSGKLSTPRASNHKKETATWSPGKMCLHPEIKRWLSFRHHRSNWNWWQTMLSRSLVPLGTSDSSFRQNIGSTPSPYVLKPWFETQRLYLEDCCYFNDKPS